MYAVGRAAPAGCGAITYAKKCESKMSIMSMLSVVSENRHYHVVAEFAWSVPARSKQISRCALGRLRRERQVQEITRDDRERLVALPGIEVVTH